MLVLASIAIAFTLMPNALALLDQTNPIVIICVNFFGVGTVMFAVALIRNIIGFVIEWIRSEHIETFEDIKLYTTIMYYVGLTSFLSAIPVVFLPEPYGAVISGIILVVLTVADVFKQAWNVIWNK